MGIRSSFKTPTKVLSKEDSDLKLLVIGRLTYYKGHEILIKAISNLCDDKTVKLSIIGGGEQRDTLKNLVSRLGLENQISFLGKVSDTQLIDEIENADLLCLPSIECTEAFGVVLLEAMRQAKPCLVSNVRGSGMSWVVQNEKTGFVAKAGDVEDWTNSLSKIQNRSDLADIGKNGFNRFL